MKDLAKIISHHMKTTIKKSIDKRISHLRKDFGKQDGKMEKVLQVINLVYS